MNKTLKISLAGLVIAICIVGGFYVINSSEEPSTPSVAQSQNIVVKNGMLFDGTGESAVQNQRIVIKDRTISCIGRECDIPENSKIIDATNRAILPGMIDLHVHFGAPLNMREWNVGEANYRDVRPRIREAYLKAGITTIRSVGDQTGYILEAKQRINHGKLDGPRIFTTGPVFTAPGGHPAGTLYRSQPQLIEKATRQVTTGDEARRQVRKLMDRGVDGIKVAYQSSEERNIPRIKTDVMKSILSEASSHDLWTAVHVTSNKELSPVLESDPTTVEHGPHYRISEKNLQRMKDHGTIFVPTFAVWETYAEGNRAWNRVLNAKVDVLRKVHERGIKIGVGTDVFGENFYDEHSFYRELEWLKKAGMTPEEILVSATKIGARALKKENKLGTVEEGKLADFLIVNGKPWNDISDVRNVRYVLQNGNIVHKAK